MLIGTSQLRLIALRLVTHMDVGNAAGPFGAGVALTFARYAFRFLGVPRSGRQAFAEARQCDGKKH